MTKKPTNKENKSPILVKARMKDGKCPDCGTKLIREQERGYGNQRLHVYYDCMKCGYYAIAYTYRFVESPIFRESVPLVK